MGKVRYKEAIDYNLKCLMLAEKMENTIYFFGGDEGVAFLKIVVKFKLYLTHSRSHFLSFKRNWPYFLF